MDDNTVNHGPIVADQNRDGADRESAIVDLAQWALNDLVAHAVALAQGQSTEDELLGAVDQFIIICKLPHTRRCPRREYDA